MVQISVVLLILVELHLSYACAATSPGSSIPRTTTASPGIRTTSSTAPRTSTTTVRAPIAACQTCTVEQVSFDKANGDPTSIDSSSRVEAPDPATGCLRLTAICAAQPGFFGFMEFNINEGGPEENLDVVQVVEALLECRDGAWYYRTIPRQVNSVQCIEAAP
ncbi:unnamed protein product [Cylicocyclus nassatus]|uniref:C6 domain-containing protein n=1 Tax=Cylicocyclus nassatus TaxID=53992 RepID=A0AA36M7V0_CYLNA|nr:unnamed protein product [Cylicocyclus nassatus]